MGMNRGCYLKLGLLRPSRCAQSPGHEIDLPLPLSPTPFASSLRSFKLVLRLIATRSGCRIGRSGRGRCWLPEGFKALAVAPHAVQDHRQLAGYRDDGSLLAPLAAAGSQLQ